MNVEKIIDLLENAGDDDNKKFALLIIFTNLIKENKLDELRTVGGSANCKQLNERLFDSIGPHFLARLIAATKLPENCSKHIYKSISMGILAQFLDYPHLIVDPVLLAKMDTIIPVLALRPTKLPVDTSEAEIADARKENELVDNLVYDTLRYLYAVGEHSQDFLVGHAGLLVNVLLNEIILKNDEFYYTKEISEADSLEDLERSGDDESTRDSYLLIACKLLLKLFKNPDDPTSKVVAAKFGSSDAKRKELLKSALMRFLQEVNKRQDEHKFNLIKVLNYFMSNTDFYHFILFDEGRGNSHADDSLLDQTGVQMFKILNDLFKSVKSLINLKDAKTDSFASKKLADLDNKYTNVSFQFLNNFVKFYQFETIYMKNRQFFYLFIHLLCSQIGFNLKMRSLQTSTNESIQNGEFTDKQDRSTIKFLNKMSIYYSLLEEIVIILSTASPFGDNDDDDDYDFDSDDDEHLYGSDDDEELDDYGNLYDAKGRPANKKLIEDKKKEKEKARQAQKDLEKEQHEPELNDAIKVIVELLQYLIEYLGEGIDSECYKGNFENCLLGVSSMRLVMCWMCHETLLEDDLVKLLPKLFKFSEYYQANTKSLTTAGKFHKEQDFDSISPPSEEFNIFKMILSGVQRILTDKKEKLKSLKEILAKANEASGGIFRSASTALPNSFSSMSISSKGRPGGVDQVKVEFEIHELEELIAELNGYRESCLRHLGA